MHAEREELPLQVDMVREQHKDEQVMKILKDIDRHSESKTTRKHFVVLDEILYYISSPEDRPRTSVYVPEHFIHLVLQQYHGENGHLGRDKTYGAIATKYYWSNLFKDCCNYVLRCPVCRRGSRRHFSVPPLESLPQCKD